MSWWDDVAGAFENLGNQIADGFNQAVVDTEKLGEQMGQGLENLGEDIASGFLPDGVANDINSFFGLDPIQQYEVPGPVVEGEPKASSDPYVPPVPDPNPPVPDPNPPVPDPNPPVPDPNPPVPDPNPPVPDPNPPVPDPNPNPRNLIQNGGDSHIEDLVPTDGGTRAGMRLGNRNLQSIPQNDLIISGNVDSQNLKSKQEDQYNQDPKPAIDKILNYAKEELYFRTFGKEMMTGEYYRSNQPPVIVGESIFTPVIDAKTKLFGENILNPLIGANSIRAPITSSYATPINNAKSQIMAGNVRGRNLQSISEISSYSNTINSAQSQIMAENVPPAKSTPAVQIPADYNVFSDILSGLKDGEAGYDATLKPYLATQSQQEVEQIVATGIVLGITYYLLSTLSIVTQSYRLLNSAIGVRLPASIRNTLVYDSTSAVPHWYFPRGTVTNAGIPMATALRNGRVRPSDFTDLRITTNSIGYYLNLPYNIRYFQQVIMQRWHVFRGLPTYAPTAVNTLPQIQNIVNVIDIGIKSIISAVSAGIAFNLYDAIKAFTTFEKYSYPRKDPLIPQSLHFGANAVNSGMDYTALKILSAVPSMFGIKDQVLSLKLVNVFWSFGKDLREGEGGIDVAIDNLFNTYIPQALDGQHILTLIPTDVLNQINKTLGFQLTEPLIISMVKKIASSGQLVELIDDFLSQAGANSDSLDGMDIFWKIFKDYSLDSILKDAIVGFKTSESPLELMVPNENLNILGFQFYNSDKQTEINTDVGAGDVSDSKFKNMEVHGVYCGPGNKLPNYEPVDALDTACMHHDIGYLKKGMYNKETDSEFVAELDTIISNPNESAVNRIKAKAFKLHFSRAIVNKYK